MKRILIITIVLLALTFHGNAQIKFPVEFKVEKQSMSTPMTEIDEIIFMHYYYTRPLNVSFDGHQLAMKYDNGEVFAKKSLTKVDYEPNYDDGKLSLETYVYTDNTNSSDYILFVVDYIAGSLQVVLTTKNSKGENVGYTSFRQFVSEEQLALN